MELASIERLLEKYFNAETTVAEEQELKEYFSRDEVAGHLQEYQPMFQYFSMARQERYTRAVPLKPNRSKYLKWSSVAAIAVIAAGVYFGSDKLTTVPEEQQYTQQELESAQKALQLFASNFSKGTQQVSYLAEFEKSTNKFLINK